MTAFLLSENRVVIKYDCCSNNKLRFKSLQHLADYLFDQYIDNTGKGRDICCLYSGKNEYYKRYVFEIKRKLQDHLNVRGLKTVEVKVTGKESENGGKYLIKMSWFLRKLS